MKKRDKLFTMRTSPEERAKFEEARKLLGVNDLSEVFRFLVDFFLQNLKPGQDAKNES